MERMIKVYAGSISYGLNTQDSDVDIRGIIKNPVEQLFGIESDFKTESLDGEDTVYFSLLHAIKMIMSGSTNVIEMLGLRPEHYLEISDSGRILLDNKHIFYSKKIVDKMASFARHEQQEVNRLQFANNKEYLEQDSLDRSLASFNRLHLDACDISARVEDDTVKVYGELKGLDVKTFQNLMNSEIKGIIKSYNNFDASRIEIKHKKIHKKMCQVIRLYNMIYDLNTTGEVVTYREKDHDLLMGLKTGEYAGDYNKILEEALKNWEYGCRNSVLPDDLDKVKLNNVMMQIYGLR